MFKFNKILCKDFKIEVLQKNINILANKLIYFVKMCS